MRQRELQAKAKSLRKQLRIIEDTIVEKRLKHQLPKIKERYEGKFFKYRNSNSLPKVPSDYWYIYFRVIKVINERECEALMFEIDKNGQITIQIRGTYFTMLGVEIKKEEYDNAVLRCRINCLAALA